MSVHGIRPGVDLSTSDVESIAPPKGGEAAPEAAPGAAAPAMRGGAAAGSRMDVQRALLEKSAAASGVRGAGSTGASGVAGNEKLRAAFDAIEGPAAPSKTYRLDGNTEAFASRWRTLEGAQKSIDTSYFIWNRDVFGMAYMGHMMRKAQQGVAVRGMIDATADAAGVQGFKGPIRGQDYLEELVGVDPKRVQFAVFNPILKKDYTSLTSAIAANHDKLQIVDGKVVETGGRNMAAHYFSDPKDHDGVYRDTDIHIKSPIAGAAATKAFEAEFSNDSMVHRVKPEKWNIVKRDIELIGAYAMMDDWLEAEPFSEVEKAHIRKAVHDKNEDALTPYVNDIMEKVLARLPKEGISRRPSWDDTVDLRRMARELVSNPELRGSKREEPATFDGEVKILDKVSASSPGDSSKVSDALVSLIDNAQDSIEIHNPYVVLTDRALEALSKAAARGVDVKIITNSPESTDSAVTQAFFIEDWPMILARVPGARILVATGDQKHHSKSFVVDGTLTGVTSYNADWLSARVNSEVLALTWSPELAKDTLASYEKDIASQEHGFVEYKIKRDADGRALLKDGKPIIEFGPEHHVDKKKLDGMLGFLRKTMNFARKNIDALSPLDHRPLDPAKDFVKVVK